MFDLSDKIESEVVDGIVSTISNPQMMIDEPVKFYRSSFFERRFTNASKILFLLFITLMSKDNHLILKLVGFQTKVA